MLRCVECLKSDRIVRASRYVQEYAEYFDAGYRQLLKTLKVPYCDEHAPPGARTIPEEDHAGRAD